MTTPPCRDSRLERQMTFIAEVDKLKQVYRQAYLADESRKENDAEHSWHLAVMAVLLAEYANTPDLDVSRVLKMVLVHDVVEIDAGDTFAYDDVGAKTKAAREQAAADRLFNMLPDDQAREFRAIWDEFEARQTPEARFAAALDRLQPMLLNYLTRGRSWRDHDVPASEVAARNKHMADGAEPLWDYASRFLEDAVEKGFLARGSRGS